MKKLQFETMCTLRKKYTVDVPDDLMLVDAESYVNDHLHEFGLDNDLAKEQEDHEPISDFDLVLPPSRYTKYVFDPTSCKFVGDKPLCKCLVFYINNGTNEEFIHEFECYLYDERNSTASVADIAESSRSRLTFVANNMGTEEFRSTKLRFSRISTSTKNFVLDGDIAIHLLPLTIGQTIGMLEKYTSDNVEYLPYAIQIYDSDNAILLYTLTSSNSCWERKDAPLPIKYD